MGGGGGGLYTPCILIDLIANNTVNNRQKIRC